MAVIAKDGVVRVTASLSRSQEHALKELANKHKVSVAWLIRYAVDQLIEQGREAQLPFDFGRPS
ncbi:ribbon-helix-helix domain-containing protein [Mesorhizobium abyssinicae]|uniref:Ribbon-helix-helix domain-containing protein n=1 Tax=Mesorhizobium abyssinicae TaxID=1209958 RepID=A0ABU5AVY5_9HYPH|nr:ribbon-helix-helix domain-containing protein [Mesorhizobium abyssinicae]MDX8541475.1 ribbon-helix-helix domain-containing protein [Mesorhizobium abyssinicae]